MQWSEWNFVIPEKDGSFSIPGFDMSSEILQIKDSKGITTLVAEVCANGGSCNCCYAFPILTKDIQWRKLKVT